MAIVVLLMVIAVAFWLSNAADAFPQVLWSWFHLSSWPLWAVALTLFSWGMKGED